MGEEVEIIDHGDDMMDEAVIRGLERAFDKRDADERAQLPEPQGSPEGVKVTGRLRRVRAGVVKHYGPGKHPGTGTDQDVHAGDGAAAASDKGAAARPQQEVSVDITSNRPGKPSEEVFDEMREFEANLREIESVRDISVKPGVGGWEGGAEPTWVVNYKGNGEALRLIAETGKQFNQDAVLVMQSPGEGGGNPVVDWHFDERVTPDERTAIEDTLVSAGIGGWTWFRDSSGRTTLRSVAVPEWGGEANKHLRSAELVSQLFSQVGYSYERSDGSVAVQVMEREGEHSYDSVIGEEQEQ